MVRTGTILVPFAASLTRIRYWPVVQRARIRLGRWRRAWRYARGTLTPSDAVWIIGDCEDDAGLYGLEWVGVDDVLETALTIYEDHPELRSLAEQAVQRVGQKWSSSGDITDAAKDWALDLIRHYAEQDGIELVERDGDD